MERERPLCELKPEQRVDETRKIWQAKCKPKHKLMFKKELLQQITPKRHTATLSTGYAKHTQAQETHP